MPAVWTGNTTPAREDIIDGRRVWTYDLVGTTVGATDEVKIRPPSPVGTISLLAYDGTVAVTPAAGYSDAFVAGSINEIDAALSSATWGILRDLRFSQTAADGLLRLRPAPGSSATVHLKVVVVEGH